MPNMVEWRSQITQTCLESAAECKFFRHEFMICEASNDKRLSVLPVQFLHSCLSLGPQQQFWHST
jgi:hypothetical protein